jgi:hypothetical protein
MWLNVYSWAQMGGDGGGDSESRFSEDYYGDLIQH